MGDMKNISVIIPVYNSDATIEECLDSLIAQTIFDDMELIIVDDCSTDRSVDKIKIYETGHPENIVLICLDKNGGPGNARNVALEYASGKYIGFVDSDDAVYPSMYEKLYNEAVRTDADYVDSGFYDQKNDRAIVFVTDELSGELNDKKRSDLIVTGGFICTKIFKRTLIDTLSMGFRREYVLEDMDYLIECTARAERISSVKEIMYVYRDTGGSMSKTDQPFKYIHNQSSAMKAIYDRTHELPGYEGIQKAVEFAMLSLYSNVINTCMNMVYLKQQKAEAVIPMMAALKEVKDAIVKGGYDSEYIRKGISDVNLRIIKANDVSPQAVLDMLRR